jgi:hypothetical protein
MVGVGANAVNSEPVPTADHESTKFGGMPELESI